MAKAKKQVKVNNDDPITGQKIVNITTLSSAEAAKEGWDIGRGDACAVIHLENGVKLYPSQDPEGNGPGCLFGNIPGGGSITVFPHQVEVPAGT